MWKPKERIKYQTVAEHWPTAEEAAASRLFAPVQVGNLTLRQRTWIPAMVPWRSNEMGEVTPQVLDWYRRFAEGRPGAIVIEATGIRDIPSGPLLRISHDRYVEGLQQLAAAVREASGGETRLFIQLIDFLSIRRRPEPGKYFQRFLKITPEHRQRLGMAGAEEDEVRTALAGLEDAALDEVLTERELECLQIIAKGLSNNEAARVLGLSKATIRTHLEHIYQKLDVTNRVEAVTEGIRQGIIDL